MNDSGAERKILVSEVVYQVPPDASLCTINYCFDLPPAHPKAKVFSIASVLAYTEKLRSAGNEIALKQLADALKVIAAQPVQGTWHEVTSGMAGGTCIIPLRNMFRLKFPQLMALGVVCRCKECREKRRAN